MSVATWHIGDSLETLRSLPDSSVDLVITSPPFLALRSYLPADHGEKHREMGSEATPGEFVDALMLVVEECRRVLAPHGSIAIELGDTYAGSGGAGGDYNDGGFREGQPKWRGYDGRGPRDTTDVDKANVGSLPVNAGSGWPLAKSLSLIPETVRFTMVYGRNPHTGRPTEPWRLRNVVRWVRPNPPPGALGDKYRPATSELLVACVSGKRFFDLDAVRQPAKSDYPDHVLGADSKAHDTVRKGTGGNVTRWTGTVVASNPAGAPPLDWWNIPTQPYKGSHYATWPKRLLEIPIKSMVPHRVCVECGQPSERITSEPEYVKPDGSPHQFQGDGWEANESGANRRIITGADNGNMVRKVETVGWSDCGHDQWRNGVVLDPFAGSGTTLEVATGMGRDAIGIDLDERNYDLAIQRVGMFLTLSTLKESGDVPI